MTTMPPELVCGARTQDGGGAKHRCGRIGGHQPPHECRCGAKGLPGRHFWDSASSMHVLVDNVVKLEMQPTLAEQEQLVARIATMFASGIDEAGIARTLRIPPRTVRAVLALREVRR